MMFLDTSGLFALHYDKDPKHAKAALHYDAETTPRLTHAGILEELIALAHARKVHRHTTLSFVEDILGDADIEIVWADPPLHRRALDLLHARPDKSYSLCDAVSFILMKDRGLADALSTDKHFEQEGFRRLLG